MVCAQISNKTFPWLSVKAKNVRVQVRLLEHLHALILSLSYALSLSHSLTHTFFGIVFPTVVLCCEQQMSFERLFHSFAQIR